MIIINDPDVNLPMTFMLKWLSPKTRQKRAHTDNANILNAPHTSSKCLYTEISNGWKCYMGVGAWSYDIA
jgi:hypothetical protein